MIKIIYLLTNRGRVNEILLPKLLNIINNNEHFLLILDESDATDKHIGLDGREIFRLVTKHSKRNDIYVSVDKDEEVNIGFIASKSLKIINVKNELINGFDLKFPQGKSEHYKHFRVIAKILFSEDLFNEFSFKGLNIVAQHNSAFIRPLRRAIQSFTAMRTLKFIQESDPESLALLVRDQNTWIPGEGRLEKLFRKTFKAVCLTDSIDRTYCMKYLEADTGGLNYITKRLYEKGIIDWISKHIITLVDKIETFVVMKDVISQLNLKVTPKYEDVDGLDHGILSISIEKL